MRVLFIYLNAFSETGGIQTFNRAFLKAAVELDEENVIEFKTLALYDSDFDSRYIRKDQFKGANGNLPSFLLNSIYQSLASDIVILGHVNLSPVGYMIKKLLRKKVYLVAHGTDVWYEMPWIKELMLAQADGILSVSHFTKEKLINVHKLDPSNISIFYNTLDPCFVIPDSFDKPEKLANQYGFNMNTKVLLTVARLSSEEKYKGYDKVIQALPEVVKVLPEIKYFIVGGGDKEEVDRVSDLITALGLNNHVVLTGFVSNEELTSYYKLADLFLMPSKGEGFGIVFLEALVCGKTIIVGNKDASREAVLDGEIGLIVDPDDISQLANTILEVFRGDIREELLDGNYLRKKALEAFGFDKYKQRLKDYVLVA